MKLHLLICLLFLSSCATKYLIPGNRFITPESQGGALSGQFELQQTGANLLKFNTKNGSVNDGVVYEDVTRMGYLLSGSLFEQIDFIWSHTGSANSMIGGKFQFIGASRTGNGTGHKASIAALFGGNEHETDDESVEFDLSGKEYILLYGYRISENVFPYASFSWATYDFSGKIHSKDALNGQRPEYVTESSSLSLGVELSFESIFAKLEATYQQLKTDHTKDKERLAVGYSIGFNW